MDSISILSNPFLNKGTGFTQVERDKLSLNGLLPPKIQTIEEQATQTYGQFTTKVNDLEKRLFLMQIFNENRTLFYFLFSQHIEEFMPIVYDPTIAQTIETYSHLFIQTQGAVYLSVDRPQDIASAIKSAANNRDIKLIVVSDAEGILGIGDWGVQGVDIAVGKLMVYTAAAGINPAEVLPVIIDDGTNRDSLLKDELYLGERHERIRGEQYDNFIDKFVDEVEEQFPDLYLHWEDFGRGNAARILDKYKDRITTFNDDIQGTGIIVLAGILGALKISGQKLTDQKYISFGAGTAGAGIVNRLYEEMLVQGLDEDEAKSHFYLVDKQGLLFEDTPDLTPEQKPFTRKRSEFNNSDELTDLLSIVKAVNPTIMVGTSTQSGAFTKEIVQEMAKNTERPIIFPISNPTKLMEATAENIIKWTDGRALVATGVPSQPVKYNGITYEIGQANNALVYPGLALGTIASTAKLLTDEMISAAAHSLGGIVDTTVPGAAVLPPVSKLNIFSRNVAIATGEKAIVTKNNKHNVTDIEEAIDNLKWTPKY
ncbi:NAD-dependent malic enzyme [Leuconostoc pseudomesenteroides]|uniref:malolactic enzyme n=1 Tax=Leuconostoc pseudomesenteroides TaxID=33968 RepID=UPI0011DDDABF|nr:malolactic enzyme [Leuconostoc pseudomesenteroides]MCT4388785.1 NAD-dependent malic enzyme [Leuconostoc pseudomesenteroides]